MAFFDGTLLRLEETEGGILSIVFDRPGSRVNLIDETWVAELAAALDRAEASGARGLLLRSAKPGQFIAGADVSLIAGLDTADAAEAKSRLGQQLFDRIERLPFATVAAVAGPCMGGGLELALACSARVLASDDRVTLALPEVRLGILPGFGGTVRMPRLVGTMEAIGLATTGRSVRPREALRLGLADRVVPAESLISAAIELARRPPARRPRPAASRALEAAAAGNPIGRALVRELSRRRIARETGGHYPAPFVIVDRILEGRALPQEEALRREAKAFGRLSTTPVAKNLLWLFRANEALGRGPESADGSAFREPPAILEEALVVGAGTMGGGIAGAFAEAGLRVRLKDVSVESLRLGLAGAAAPLRKRVARRRLGEREEGAILARISPTLASTGFGRANVVLEAVPEILDLKIRVLREVEALVPEETILATNTSSIPIERIAAGLASPERLVGIHFFNPVHRMPLVEIIPGTRTSERTVRRAVALVRRLKKSPLVVADAPGFLVNRLLMPYLDEAALAVDDGWPVEAIDRALVRFGMPMGPLRVLDEVGLDVARHVARVLEEAFGARARPAAVLERLLAAKALGVKSGRGFWIHEGKRRRPNDAAIAAPRRAAPPDAEIADRLLLGMVAEAARCLAERVVSEPGHLDLGTVLGAGFPPFTGGVRRWARSLGEAQVRRRLHRLTAAYGDRFAAPPHLDRLFEAER